MKTVFMDPHRFTSKTQPTLSRKQKRQLLDKQEYVRLNYFFV